MFIQYNGNPCGVNTGDCVIRAISIATGFSRHKVYAGLCLAGYDCTVWGNNNQVWSSYLQSLGYVKHAISRKCTVAGFAGEHPTGRYILGTGSHAVAVIDGDYIDSWDSGGEIPLYYFAKER